MVDFKQKKRRVFSGGVVVYLLISLPDLITTRKLHGHAHDRRYPFE